MIKLIGTNQYIEASLDTPAVSSFSAVKQSYGAPIVYGTSPMKNFKPFQRQQNKLAKAVDDDSNSTPNITDSDGNQLLPELNNTPCLLRNRLTEMTGRKGSAFKQGWWTVPNSYNSTFDMTERTYGETQPAYKNPLRNIAGNEYRQPYFPTSQSPSQPTLSSSAYNPVLAHCPQFFSFPNWGYVPYLSPSSDTFYPPYTANSNQPYGQDANKSLTGHKNGSMITKEPETWTPKEKKEWRESESGSRSRSRSRKPIRKSISPKKSKRDKQGMVSIDQRKGIANTKQRPQKFMLKVIFTPLKRILKSKRLIDLGIDMNDYFSVREQPLGGHRTPADIELMLWYVEEKYYETPELYGRFVDYLVENRRDLELYGEQAYGEKYSEVWLAEYRKLLNTIYNGIQTKGSSNARFQNLYSRRPSEQSFHNLRELKELFYSKGVIPRPTNK